jgi:N-acetylglucosamine kinase-like BadF-type ATPase
MVNISVDGGGTKINIVAFDECHCMLGFGIGGGINIRYETKETVCKHIKDAINQCMKNIGEKNISTVYCTMVGGYELFKYTINELGYTIERFVPMPEGYTYLLAGGLTQSGFVALSGTGSGVIYCESKDKYHHLGGYGTPVGDEGSGAWIGIKGINAVTRFLSGWGKETILTERLHEYLGITQNPSSILSALYPQNRSTRSLYAGFAAIVGKEADLGDTVALNIIQEAGRFMGEQMVAAVKMHSNDTECINIYACGGAWKCSSIMFDSFKEFLLNVIPTANCFRSVFDPVVGGVLQSVIESNKDMDEYFHFLIKEYSRLLS